MASPLLYSWMNLDDSLWLVERTKFCSGQIQQETQISPRKSSNLPMIGICRLWPFFVRWRWRIKDGNLFTFGRNQYGQLELGDKTNTNVPEIVNNVPRLHIPAFAGSGLRRQFGVVAIIKMDNWDTRRGTNYWVIVGIRSFHNSSAITEWNDKRSSYYTEWPTVSSEQRNFTSYWNIGSDRFLWHNFFHCIQRTPNCPLNSVLQSYLLQAQAMGLPWVFISLKLTFISSFDNPPTSDYRRLCNIKAGDRPTLHPSSRDKLFGRKFACGLT